LRALNSAPANKTKQLLVAKGGFKGYADKQNG
jgi:hypothetical protein